MLFTQPVKEVAEYGINSRATTAEAQFGEKLIYRLLVCTEVAVGVDPLDELQDFEVVVLGD